ncbi:T9SS type A sorting domain-containing protein [Flavobacterium pectinovorum]|uniref:T9SS type A sorting domain-containing protein n=1 Tax=Flavobacterium pectinovorum TaxID=29533 RepID=UPI001FAD94B0|nr:T9SS type A sorting domain-containing protein [Flavobacterium pectinovorum]MCI9844083.1 T9SS type A sorting domain-containing protein [Flavobacterium pectinovorum]
MIKKLLFTLLLTSSIISAQSYAPAAGETGSTAIAKSSTVFIGWATGITVVRGPQDIANPTGPLATGGTPNDGMKGGTSGSGVVCLGDGGSATLTFDTPIANGPGFDFAVFENGFKTGGSGLAFLELAFVEVSSDGVNFFRFPSHSETQTNTQVGPFAGIDCRYINNLAGKYVNGYGTPFDLSDIADNAFLDKDNITHVKIIDVIGTIDPLYASYDSFGRIINDPYSTPFPSGGFDLNGVGVINQKTLGNKDFNIDSVTLYPNPASNIVYLNTEEEKSSIVIYDINGKIVKKLPKSNHKEITVFDMTSGTYLFEVTLQEKKIIKKIIIN